MRIQSRLGKAQLQIHIENVDRWGMSLLNGIQGAFVGIEGIRVKLLGRLMPGQEVRMNYIVPYESLVAVHPTAKNQYAFIIEDGPNFGKQCYVWQIQNNQCYCGTPQRRKKLSMEYILLAMSLYIYY